MKNAAVLALLLFQSSVSLAMSAPDVCDTAALRAAEEYGIPANVMLAITRVETGRKVDGHFQPWPWAVNQAGASHWFDTAQEAQDFVETAISSGFSNIDIGCFQLNLRWHGEAFSSVADMFDPERNANYAAQFLLDNHQRRGNWVDAVAAYHSATPKHAQAYILKVENILGDLAIKAPVTEDRADQPAKNNRFPLLKPGTTGAMASLVPAGSGVGSLFATAP